MIPRAKSLNIGDVRGILALRGLHLISIAENSHTAFINDGADGSGGTDTMDGTRDRTRGRTKDRTRGHKSKGNRA